MLDIAKVSDFVGLGMAFAALVGLLFVLFISWRSLIASYKLIRHTLYHGAPLSRLRTLRELWHCFLHILQTKGLYRAVRLAVELQILRPPPPPTEPDDYSREGIRAAAREHRRQMQDWRRKTWHLMSILAAEVGKDGPVIRLGEWFQVSAAEPRILRYFAVVNDPDAHYSLDTGHFLSTVEIYDASIAPIHLLRGLLHKFEEDWGPIVDSYSAMVRDPKDLLRRRVSGTHLRAFQAYMFDCWLLWGPSVPICTCREWEGDVAVQLGYGDENNSFPLILDPRTLLPVIEACTGEAGRPLAYPATVHANIFFGHSLPEHRLCQVQQNVRGGLALVAREVTLRTGDHLDGGSSYYSAYVWVMFVMLRENGRPVYQNEVWRGLLPFFEHANIADGRTLEVFKRQLAHKALSSIESFVQTGDRIRFGFACATDESGCGHGLRFESAAPTVRAIMEELLESEYRDLLDTKRIDLSTSMGAAHSACHMPAMLERYFSSLAGKIA